VEEIIFYALVWLTARYKHIAHVESDCWIFNRGKAEFLYYLNQEGYFTGFTQAYNFPEASLQIINSNLARQYLIDKYSCTDNWHENIDFEKDLERLSPTYILNGDRIDGVFNLLKDNFTYVAGMKYQDFKKAYGDG
jgi:hypothetical protein